MKLFHYLRFLRRRFLPYQPLVEVVISRSALLHNLHTFQKNYPDLTFAPVLKSNAYGHGLIEVATMLDSERVAFFVLDSLFEATLLRKNNIKTKLLIIGYTRPEDMNRCRLSNTTFVMTSLDQLHRLDQIITRPITLHLKIDTGMHRQGILPAEISEAMAIIKHNKKITLEGICSHLADADNSDESFSETQLRTWEEAIKQFQTDFPNLRYIHIAASAGVRFSTPQRGNVVRLGFGLYGFDPSPHPFLDLKPALELRTIISSVKKIKAGESVGYGHTYTFSHDTTIATIPVGYFEGVDRRLSHQGLVKVRGKDCPIVGRVSMNITSIDVSSVPDIMTGESVTVISATAEDKNSVKAIAEQYQTIPWEIVVHIPSQLRRTVIE